MIQTTEKLVQNVTETYMYMHTHNTHIHRVSKKNIHSYYWL